MNILEVVSKVSIHKMVERLMVTVNKCLLPFMTEVNLGAIVIPYVVATNSST